MTTVTYGWDASHYDGTITKAIAAKAAAEGIAFFTHKLGEGLHTGDSTQATSLASARDAGIRILGGYWFVHGNDNPVDEAHACVAMADQCEPWWRTFPGWFWQTDAETSPTGLPSPAYVKAFSDELTRLTDKVTIVYASHGMYGDRLKGLGHYLWNANYPSNRQAPFKDLYPGNGFSGWSAYSGQVPVICQYSSSATIGGLTTCDVNAFRGTVDELVALITPKGAKPTSPTPTPQEDDMAFTAEELVDAFMEYKLPDGQSMKAWFQANDARTNTLVNVEMAEIVKDADKLANPPTPAP